MNKFFVLFPIIFFLTNSFALDELPRPLPDDSYPSDPDTDTNPNPPPTPTPENPNPNPYPPRHETQYSVGVIETSRFKTRTYNLFPRKNFARFVRLSILGLRNKNEIKNIRLFYADKSSYRDLFELNGKLAAGEMRQAELNGGLISKIQVTASGSYILKSSGSFRIDGDVFDDDQARR
ncbi:MAG: hypothetical protein ACXVCY_04035 [Pseudobdellovibrionaceae bacterium]